MERKKLFEAIIKHFGSQRAMARALLVTESAVSQWVASLAIPPKSAIKIEKMIGSDKFRAVDMVAE